MKSIYVKLGLAVLVVLAVVYALFSGGETNNTTKSKPLTSTVNAEGVEIAQVMLTSPEGKEVFVMAEVAANDESRKKGLMHREALARNSGMLFVWADKQVRTFWMKDTLIALDMIFIDDTNIIGTVEKAQPESEKPRYAGVAGNAVLETNAGFIRKHRINNQWKVSYVLSDTDVE